MPCLDDIVEFRINKSAHASDDDSTDTDSGSN
jgi:hypothetical protein